jgi:N6-L-threonylcarbamoyladenine synthase
MRILAIETSCDETALALLKAEGRGVESLKLKVEKSVIASQVKLHAKYGGVVPNLAKREHIRNLPVLLKRIGLADSSNLKLSPSPKLRRASKTPFFAEAAAGRQNLKIKENWKKINLIAVTVGPGLEPALWTGIQFANELSEKWGKPLIGANHLDGHLYSFLLSQKTVSQKLFPAIALIVSGGHTILVLLKNLKEYRKLGETLDDAVGESFDKVARLLNLPYPGGPALEKLAKKGNSLAIPFPSPMLDRKNYDFSYSGLKTAVLYYLKNLGSAAKNFSLSVGEREALKKIEKQANVGADIAASFQYAAFNSLAKKSARAAKEFRAKSILIGGGVAANKTLPKMIKKDLAKSGLKINVIVPPLKYCMDNAVMIGLAAYISKLKNKSYKLKADGNINL